MRTRNVVALVAAAALVGVMTPIGVMAATGTLVNITDPYYPERRARVTTSNSLQAETRAGAGPNVVSQHWTADTLESFEFMEVTGPDRIALTQVTLGSVGPANGTTTGHHYIDVISYVQGTGTASCGASSSGYTVKTLTRLVVRNFFPSVQTLWNGPALLSPSAPAGKKSCVVFRVNTYTTGSVIYISATGYRMDG